MLAYSIGKDSITLFIDDELCNVDKTHRNFEKLREELLKPDSEQDLEKIKKWSSMASVLRDYMGGIVQISDSEMLFEGKVVSGHIADKIVELAAEGDNVDPYINFFMNLQKNPNKDVAGDLFKWVEAGKMPITPDGRILAFKKVNKNYTDCHTGKFDNSVGAILKMPREKCDSDRSNTCSTGFHFCSVGYLGNFRGERIMSVAVNPADVTAIPPDYNLSKGRCCTYEVVGELSEKSATSHDAWKKAVLNVEDPAELPPELFTALAGKTKKVTTTKTGDPKKPRKAKAKTEAQPKGPTGAKPKTKAKKAATKPTTVKEIVKKSVVKATQPKKPTSPTFLDRGGAAIKPSTVASFKKKVEDKKITLKDAANQLNTATSTLSGWFKKV